MSGVARHAHSAEARPLRGRRGVALLVALLLAIAVALVGVRVFSGSSRASSREAVFHVQNGVRPGAAAQSCLLHQTDEPTTGFRGGSSSMPMLELPFLAYYTANGNKPFCDGRPPTEVDKTWARLYQQLTGDRAAVDGILSR